MVPSLEGIPPTGLATTGCYDILEGEITIMFHDREASIRSLSLAALLCGAIGCRQSETPPDSADIGKSPQETLQGMIVAEGLEVTLFALILPGVEQGDLPRVAGEAMLQLHSHLNFET